MVMMMNKGFHGASVVSTLILMFCILFLFSFEIQMASAHVHTGAGSAGSAAGLLRGSASSEMHKLGGALAAQRYMSNDEINNYLAWITSAESGCNAAMSVENLGSSVQGTPMNAIWVAHPDLNTRSAPEYVFLGNMHGNEPLGRQLLIYFLEVMCEAYQQLDSATISGGRQRQWMLDRKPELNTAQKLLQSVRVAVVPFINPDGFAAHRRENSKGVDLNRDFPDQFRHGANAMEHGRGGEQPETLAAMSFHKRHSFAAGANFHEGALVANYPWDGTAHGSGGYNGVPGDDATFRSLARSYASLHPKMRASREFKEGITNGAQWYPLWGGMQDYAYLQGGCLELTIELNDRKWPSAPELHRLWDESKGAFFGHPIAALVDSGLHGVVKDGTTGQPILGASVRLVGRPELLRGTKVDAFGGFHLAMANGERASLHVTAEGYESLDMHVAIPSNAALNNVKIALRRSETSNERPLDPPVDMSPPPPDMSPPPPPPPPVPAAVVKVFDTQKSPPNLAIADRVPLLTRLMVVYATVALLAFIALLRCGRSRRGGAIGVGRSRSSVSASQRNRFLPL